MKTVDTFSDVAAIQWSPITTKMAGSEYIAEYRHHWLDVFNPWSSRWQWSMSHPIQCGQQRGASGVADSQQEAQRAAVDAVKRLRCAPPLTPY